MRIKKIYKVLGVRVVLAVFTAMIAAVSFGGLIFTQPAFADSASWASPTTITYGGITWTEISTSGNDMTLGGQDYVCGPGKMVINNYASTSPASGTLTLPNKMPCSNPPQTIQITLTNTWQSVGGSPTGTSGSPSADDCPVDESSALRWVLCPVFDIGIAALGWMVGAINSFLYTPTQQIFGTTGPVQIGGGPSSTQVSENPDMQGAFNSFRNIALGFLVIAGLVMVIAQAANLEIFAAYTVRKALPRIVIAAIGISLAWPILQFVVIFFDDLGVWTGSIILAVTHVSTGSGAGIAGTANAIVAALLAGFTAVGAYVVMGIGGILPVIGTLLLAALVGLIVLAVRQLVILMCIILAPLAIAASVLPGTYKLWDFWQDTFTGALLMYPLIMGFLTGGMAMAGIAGAAGAAQRANNGGSGAVWDLLALLAYFAPFFFLPFMFRIAGGIMGGVHSMVNGKFQGGFKQLSEKRQQATAVNKQKLLEGRRKMLPSWVNSAGKTVGAFQSTDDKIGFITNRKGQRDIAEARWGKITQAKYAHEEGAGATQYWDDMLHAQKYSSAAEARKKLGQERGWDDARVDKAIRQAEAQGGFGFAQRQYAVEQLAANGTGYENMGDALNSIAIASGGNKEIISNMVGGVRSLTERAGRVDIKGDFDKMNDIAAAISERGGIDDDIAGRIQSQTVKAARSFDNATLVRQKPKAVQNAINALSGDLQKNLDIVNGVQPGDVGEASKEVGRIRAKLENMVGQATIGYGSEVNQEKINELMKSSEYDKLNRQMDNMMQPRPTQFTNPAGQVIQLRGPAYQPISVQPSPQAPQPSPTPATPGGGAGQPQPVMVQQQPGVYTQQQPVQMVNAQGQPIVSQQQAQQQASARPANGKAAQYWDYNSQRRIIGDRNDPRFPTLPGGDES